MDRSTPALVHPRRGTRALLASVLALTLLAVAPVGAPATAAAPARVQTAAAVAAEPAPEPVLYRAINLNGPAMTAGGIPFEAGTAAGVTAGPRSFCNQTVPVVPAVEPAMATMLRCSVWGSGNPGARVTMTGVPAGTYQVSLYAWEDNYSQTYGVVMNGATVATGVVSGPAGTWRLLGPFDVPVTDGTLNVFTTGGAANLSGIVLRTAGGTPPPPPENRAPTVTNPGAQSGTVGVAIPPLQIVASDPDAGQALAYSATGLPAGLTLAPTTGVVSGTPTAAGTSAVTVTVTDNGSPALTASTTFDWTIAAAPPPPENRPPTVTSPGAQGGTVGVAIAPLQIVASDPDAGQTLTYSAAGLPAGLTLAPATGVVSGTPTAAGTSAVTVTVTDNGSPALTASTTFDWTVAAAPPPDPEPGLYRAINLNGPAITVGGVPFEASTAAGVTAGPKAFCKQSVPLIPATDAATATMLRCSVWGSGNPGARVSLTGVPNGTYQVGLYVWEDNTSTTFNVVMNGASVATSVVSGPAGTWKLLGPFTVPVTDGTLTVFSTGGSANFSGLVVHTGSGTPPPSNRAPVVTSPGSQGATVGTAIAPLTITAADPDAGQVVTFAATGLPAGLSIDAATGVVSGTPTTAGTSSVTVTATDNGTPPLSGSTTFTWTVAPPGTGGGGFDPTKVTDSFVAGGNWTRSLAADWLPDGTMLVLTEAGLVFQVNTTTGAQTLVLDITAKVFSQAEAGVLDILTDAAGTGFYLYYSVAGSDRLRISHFTVGSSVEQVIWDNPGLGYNADRAVHLGGSLNLGPDGKLYLSIGDRYEGRSQDLTNVFGKVLRINTDGTVPTDNPFYDGAGPNVDEIWAYGFRNPYRAHFDEATGLLWVGDVGGNVDTQAYEEVNIVQRGANYGWPACEGPVGAPKNGPLCPAGVTGPVHYYSHAVGAGCCQNRAIVGGEIYRGSAFPLGGRYIYTDYAIDTFFWVELGPDGRTEAASGILNQVASSVPVWLGVGPDGNIYWLSLGFGGGGQLRRLTYTGSVNSPPAITAASATPTTGAAPLAVAFTGAATDPDGTPVSYSWAFGDGATSTAQNPTHTYTSNGTYQARLQVTSGGTTVSSDLITIVVGTPPTVQITSPADGTTFVAGDTIVVTGTGNDPDTGALAPGALSWDVQFLHNEHAHPVTSGTGSDITLTVPESGHDFTGDTRYLVTLTGTDPDGVTASASIILRPTKTSVPISSNQATTITVNGITQTLPHTIDALVGFQYAVSAPASRCVSGRTWTFQSWSDGGARTHTVVAAPGLALVATYADTGSCTTVGTLKVSTSSSRSGAVALEGATLAPATPVYIFFEFVVRPAKVEFWLDQPTTSPPRHVESGAPYDFAGGTTSAANPFNPGTLTPGAHTITTRVTKTDGTTETFDTGFFVGSP